VTTDLSALLAPGSPTNLTASAIGNVVTLTWTAPSSGDAPTSYVIEAGSSSGASNLANFDTGSTATALMATAVPPGTYFVRVRARNAASTSGASNETAISVGGGPGPCTSIPGAPIGLTASVSGTVVTLTWNAASGDPTSYVIEAGSSPGTSDLANFDTRSTATSFTATAVSAGTYFLRVRARNACGTGGPSNEVTVTVGLPVPLLLRPERDAVITQNDPSTGCAFLPTRGYGFQIIFEWTAVTAPAGVSGYELFVIGPNATIPLVNRLVNASLFHLVSCGFVADPNLRGWLWRVRTKDAQGMFGAWSPTRTFSFAPCRLSDGTSCRS
jgi:hypothetical protein